jgi:hypothetical protein
VSCWIQINSTTQQRYIDKHSSKITCFIILQTLISILQYTWTRCRAKDVLKRGASDDSLRQLQARISPRSPMIFVVPVALCKRTKTDTYAIFRFPQWGLLDTVIRLRYSARFTLEWYSLQDETGVQGMEVERGIKENLEKQEWWNRRHEKPKMKQQFSKLLITIMLHETLTVMSISLPTTTYFRETYGTIYQTS